jgi:peptide/nickel transport system permease protein
MDSTVTTELESTKLDTRSESVVARLWHIVRRYPVFPVMILVAVIFGAAFAPMLSSYDPQFGNLAEQMTPPFWNAGGSTAHLLGTDSLGRDIVARLLHGARLSLWIAAVVLLAGGLTGTVLGMISGYFSGWVDEAIMRFVDLTLGVPFILVALVSVIVFGPSLSLIILLLIIFSWSGFARQIRAEIIRLKEMDYVAYSKLSGASTVRIFGRHLFPGVFNTVLVIATLQVGNLIIAESSLSFLGVGIPAPSPAWGVMVADGKNFISFAYWISLFPGLAIFMLVYSLNFIGDWTRDRLDPRLRQI